MSAPLDPPANSPPTAAPRPPLLRRVLHVVRRAHLYLGLFLLPWAVLYGVTAFLFNHPAAFPDQPTATFGKEAAAGTPLESLPSPRELAGQVVAKLNERHQPATPYTLGPGEVKYSREFAFATVKGDGQTVSVLLDVKNGGGTVRATPDKPKADPVKAPFAVGGTRSVRPSPGGSPPTLPDGVFPDGEPMAARIKAAVPTILERTGFPAGGEVTVTSVPELVFPVEADGTTWTSTYNPTTGSVSGTPLEPPAGLSGRQFLLRLHTAHGYPGEPTARWGWAVIVDVTAGVMVFWGLSGLLMWWQVKAARWPGAAVLVLSAAAATWLGFAMHEALAG